MEQYMDAIRLCELFIGIPEEDIPALLKCMHAQVRHYEKDDVICREGERRNATGVVLSGRIYMESNDFLGNNSIVAEYTAGRCYGESYAFAGNAPALFRVVAREPSEILVFELCQYAMACTHSCNSHKRMTENLIAALAEKSMELSSKIHYLSRRTTREKLIAYLSDQSKRQRSRTVTIPFNRQELADYLAVDRSAMSKELSRMRGDGLIDCRGRVFTLHYE